MPPLQRVKRNIKPPESYEMPAAQPFIAKLFIKPKRRLVALLNGKIQLFGTLRFKPLSKHGYPPATRDEVFKAIFEQAENFKKNRVEKDEYCSKSHVVKLYPIQEGELPMAAEDNTQYGGM